MARNKWAKGITPRHFTWIVKGRLAVSERPGGYGPAHRRVRRQEEIIWLREQGFTRVVSLIPSVHNLHAYEEMELEAVHIPWGNHDDPRTRLREALPVLDELMAAGETVLVHREELGDHVGGLVAAWLLWSGKLPNAPAAITVTERILGRQLTTGARRIVAAADVLRSETA